MGRTRSFSCEAGLALAVAAFVAAAGIAEPAPSVTECDLCLSVSEPSAAVCEPAGTAVPSDTLRLFLRVRMEGPIYEAHEVIVRWHDPIFGDYAQNTIPVPDPNAGGYTLWNGYVAWGWLDIAGTPAAERPGRWRVDTYVDGGLKCSKTFEMTASEALDETVGRGVQDALAVEAPDARGDVTIRIEVGAEAAGFAYAVLFDTVRSGGSYGGTAIELGPDAAPLGVGGRLDERGIATLVVPWPGEASAYYFQLLVAVDATALADGAFWQSEPERRALSEGTGDDVGTRSTELDGSARREAIGPDTVGSLSALMTWDTSDVPVFAFAFSPGGSLLYAAHGNRLTIRSLLDGSIVSSWPVHPGYVAGLGLSPEGTLAATAGNDAIVRIWDTASGDPVRELSPAGTHAVAFSSDGRRIGSVDLDGRLRVWDVASGNPVWFIDAGSRAFSLAFSPDDSIVVTAHGRPDFAVRAWSAQSGELVWESLGHTADAHAVAFSPDGRTVASVGADTLVVLRDASSGAVLRILAGHTQPVFEVLFVSDRLLATGDGGGTIRFWDPETGRVVRTLRAHRGEISALAVSSDATMLATAAFDMEAILWRVP